MVVSEEIGRCIDSRPSLMLVTMTLFENYLNKENFFTIEDFQNNY